MIFPFSQLKQPSPYGGGGGFADSADGASVAADGSAFLVSDNAEPLLRPTYNFHDISVLGTELGTLAGVDDGLAAVTLATFLFPFYGTSFSTMKVSTNGYIFFGTTPSPAIPSFWTPSGSAPPSVNTLPSDDDPDNLIAPLLKDYRANHVYVKEVASPNRLIVQWDVWDTYATSAQRDVFQAVLHEDGSIYFYYSILGSDVTGANSLSGHTGAGWTSSPMIIGCQNSTHTVGTFVGGNNPLNDGAPVGKLPLVNMAIRLKAT